MAVLFSQHQLQDSCRQTSGSMDAVQRNPRHPFQPGKVCPSLHPVQHQFFEESLEAQG
uniref:Uncharacterized protein n=1 Tax=Arundo donax TaxID=35708 RepID=A0A0A9G0Z1_ARUDO